MMKTEPIVPDNELILMAQVGNDRALESLVGRYLPAVYGACWRYLGNQADAEDAVQDTYVKVWRNLKKIDPKKNFKAWTLTIAKNTCLDIIKRKRTVPMSAFDDEQGNNYIADAIESPAPSPAAAAEQSLLARLLGRALDKLSPAYRKVLSLYYQEGLNFREISETLNEPLHTVKSRHRRAIINLRLVMAENEL